MRVYIGVCVGVIIHAYVYLNSRNYAVMHVDTHATAQGGGGSFKYRTL